MTRSLDELRRSVHREVNAHRALDRLVSSEDFKEAYSKEPNAAVLESILKTSGIEAIVQSIEKWIAGLVRQDIGELPMGKLREIAAKHRIKYYATLSRAQLLSAIANAQQAEVKRLEAQNELVGMPHSD